MSRALLGSGTDQIDLIVLPGQIANVDVEDVIGVVDAKDRVVLVPIDEVRLLGLDKGQQGGEHDGQDDAIGTHHGGNIKRVRDVRCCSDAAALIDE